MDDLLRELQTPVEDWIQACVGLGVLAWAFRMAWEHWDGLLGMPGRYAITISGFVFLAGPAMIFRRVVLPQVMPGILSGAIIVFALAASAFATPAIIGGRRLKVVATLAYDEFLNTLNWPLGAAVAVLLVLIILVITVGCGRLVERRYAQIFE